MKRSRVIALGLTVALVAAAGLAVSLPWGSAATAQGVATPEASRLVRSITVVGQGTVIASPDIAQVTIGVEAIAATVAEASSQASDTMDAIVAALTDMGVAAEDVQTAEYNVYVDASTSTLGTAVEPTYHVINMVGVSVRDLTTVGDVIDAAVQAGANRIYGVGFAIDDTSAVESAAREQAVADALKRASHLASLVGASVGDVISVSEVVGGGYQTYPSLAQADSLGGGTSISPGQLQFTTSIQVVYELVPAAVETAATPESTGTPLAAEHETVVVPPEATRMASATVTPGDDTASYTLDLVANPVPAETDDGLLMVGWVQVIPDGEADPTQSLEVVFHNPFEGWDEGDQIIGELGYLITDDINFDGYQDFAVIEPGGASWQVSHWYLYDAESEQFITNEFTDQLALLPWNTYFLDADSQEITVVNQTATGPLVTIYSVQDGTLSLVSADEGAPTIENGPFSEAPASG